ncbi:MAG TPA: hypothetical protein PKE47_12615 [Verrucomicrobiota bacterium]|nr:hypothetical protein [Verrucomicrobiota bacterium]
MKPPATHRPEWLTPAAEAHLRDLELEFQVREFGEEMAAVNRLPLPLRRQYMQEVTDRAVLHGVNLAHPADGITP